MQRPRRDSRGTPGELLFGIKCSLSLRWAGGVPHSHGCDSGPNARSQVPPALPEDGRWASQSGHLAPARPAPVENLRVVFRPPPCCPPCSCTVTMSRLRSVPPSGPSCLRSAPPPRARSPPANAFLKHPASGRLHSALCPAAPSSAPCQTLGLTGVPSAQGNEPAQVILSRGCHPPLSCRVLLSHSPGSPARPPPRPRPAGWPSCPLAPAFPSQNFAKLKIILYDFALFLLSPEGQKFSPISSVLYLQHLA